MATNTCLITPDLAGPTRNGGIGTHCLYLARFLSRQGHAVTIVHTGAPDDADRATWKQTYAAEHGATLLFLDELPDEPAVPVLPHTAQHRTAHRVYHWLRGQAFDAIHFQDWQGNGAICARAKQTGVAFQTTRLIVTVHGPSEWIRAGMHEFPTQGRESLIDDALERTAIALADTIVSPSEHLLAWLGEHRWKLPADTRVIPLMFEAPSTTNPPRALGPGELREIVFFGRLETRKGIEPFLDALGAGGFRSALNGTNHHAHGDSPTKLQVHFVGKPHTTLRGPARDLIAECAAQTGSQLQLEIHENWNHREALAWLAEHPQALVVTPSLADNSPFSVIECLALGQPLLAGRRGGIPELIASPEHLVEPTAEALGARLTTVLREGLPAIVPRWDAAKAVAGWTELAGEPADAPATSALPAISVCVPHFNQPELLNSALERLAHQSVPPHEVIIVDDGSAPEHEAFWSRLEQQHHSRGWKFVRAPHAGPSVARNTAARVATGDALVFCDADNVALPDMLEKFGRALTTSGSEIVTCAFAAHLPNVDGSWPEVPEYVFCPVGDAPELALIENYVGDTNFIARRDTFLALGGFDESRQAISEDWGFLLRAIVAGRAVAILPEITFRYRLTPASRARSHSDLEASLGAWRALPPAELERYERLLLATRGTFAAFVRLQEDVKAAHAELDATRQNLGAELQATHQHAINVEGINRHLEAANSTLTREIEGMRSALSAANQLREQLKQMGLARDQVAHDLAHQGETLEIARHELQVQESRRQEMERRHQRVREENARLQKIIELRDAKIRHIQESMSWRSTAPFRALRRMLVDRQAAPQAVSVPVADEPDASFLISVDVPTVWDAAPAAGSFTGWCISTTGVPARSIRALVGPNEFVGRYGIRRADVALAHKFHSADSALCGFQISYKLVVDVDYQVVIEVLNPAGHWVKVFERILHTSSFPRSVRDYTAWVESFGKPTPERVGALRARLARLPVHRRPLLSILLPVFNPPRQFLERAIETVRTQIYENWELCIADDCSTDPEVRQVLERFAQEDPRIRVVYRPENGHISRASNSALELARGEFVVLLDHDDELSWDALAEVAVTLGAHPETDVVYSDEDKIDDEGQRFDPYFKPDFLPDLLAGQNCFSHLSVFRTKLVRDVGGFRPGFEGSQDWDLALRIIDASSPERVRHIPKVLYHWRAISGSTAIEVSEKSYSLDSARRALKDHFERRGMSVEIRPVPGAHWQVVYPLPEKRPLVSIVIPSRNAAKFLRTCVDSIFARTSYAPFEVVVVNNRSDDSDALALLKELAARPQVRVVDHNAPFNFSAIVNFGVRHAKGDIVVLLNNDIEATSDHWLSEMVSHAVRPEIGAVGAMLYYPNDTIQHAGIVLGLGGVANHAFGHHARGTDGYKNRARLVQNFSAVTAACLAIRRDVFNQVGGFNEADLPIAFNDVDFCIRVRNAGYRNLWTPFAELVHHESASRGRDDTPEKQARFEREVAFMRATWGEQLDHDPAYSVNLALSMEGWDLAWPPRT